MDIKEYNLPCYQDPNLNLLTGYPVYATGSAVKAISRHPLTKERQKGSYNETSKSFSKSLDTKYKSKFVYFTERTLK